MILQVPYSSANTKIYYLLRELNRKFSQETLQFYPRDCIKHTRGYQEIYFDHEYLLPASIMSLDTLKSISLLQPTFAKCPASH